MMPMAISLSKVRTAFDKPSKITLVHSQLGQADIQRGSEIFYNGDFQRNAKEEWEYNELGIKTTAAPKETTLYVGKEYERITDSNGTRHRYTIAAGSTTVQVERADGSAVDEAKYMLGDNLGSTNVILDAAGNEVQRLAFDPWGMRTNADPGTSVNQITNKGYTGHEMDDETGVVNMNARIYDPYLGRFLSPDTLVPNPYDLQQYNRYSYVSNNPLKFVDPSGNCAKPSNNPNSSCYEPNLFGSAAGSGFSVSVCAGLGPVSVCAGRGGGSGGLGGGISVSPLDALEQIATAAGQALGLEGIGLQAFVVGTLLNNDAHQETSSSNLPGGLSLGEDTSLSISENQSIEEDPSFNRHDGFSEFIIEVAERDPDEALRLANRTVAQVVTGAVIGIQILCGVNPLCLGVSLGSFASSGEPFDLIVGGRFLRTADETNTVFRVQGGVRPNASKARFIVDDAGGISIQGTDMLFINLGQKERAFEFLARRGDTASLVQFQVTEKFANQLRSSAVAQRVGRQFPGSPQRVDEARAADQFGIPSSLFDDLLKNIVPGSVKVSQKK